MQGSVSSWMSRVDGEMNQRLISELKRAPPGGDAPLSGVAAPQRHRQQPGNAPRAGNDKGTAAPSEADLTTSLLTRLVRVVRRQESATTQCTPAVSAAAPPVATGHRRTAAMVAWELDVALPSQQPRRQLGHPCGGRSLTAGGWTHAAALQGKLEKEWKVACHTIQRKVRAMRHHATPSHARRPRRADGGPRGAERERQRGSQRRLVSVNMMPSHTSTDPGCSAEKRAYR